MGIPLKGVISENSTDLLYELSKRISVREISTTVLGKSSEF